jgi:purine-binding chemotaxis protein CheW
MNQHQSNELIQLVSFRLGNEEFAVEILRVQEINRMVEITHVPQVPHFVDGIINLRGKVIPVVDLRTKFGMETKDRDKNSRIVVCDVGGETVGMVVDAVSEVLRVPQSTVEAPPEIVRSSGLEYIRGVVKLEERLLLFLDISKLATEVSQAMNEQLEPA